MKSLQFCGDFYDRKKFYSGNEENLTGAEAKKNRLAEPFSSESKIRLKHLSEKKFLKNFQFTNIRSFFLLKMPILPNCA